MNFSSTRRTRRPLVLAVALALSIGSAHAATINVNTGGDAGTATTCTLRQALVAANTDSVGTSNCTAGSGGGTSADTIEFDQSLADTTITLTGGELGVSQPLIINGSGQTIDAAGLSRVLSMNSIALTASSLTFTGGLVTGSAGGGIFVNYAGVLDLTDVTIAGNSTDDEGGGIYLRSGATLILADCTISGNSADNEGGGIYLDNDGTLTLTGSTISGNSASDEGAGIYLGQNAALSVTDSTISGNSTGGSGGGVYGWGHNPVSVVGSTISGNSSSYTGGGIYVWSSSVTMSDSTISGNTADTGGGVFASKQSSLTFANSTISGNIATSSGGGIYAVSKVYGGITYTTSVILQNTIVSANTSPIEPDLAAGSGVPVQITAASSLLGAALSASYGGNNNVFSDAPGLGTLGINGGPTPTMLPLAGSPAIDAGDNSLIPAGVTTDQRGAGYARIANTTVDIGAVEVQAAAPLPVASVSVPTSAPWALGLLGLLLGFFGLHGRRRRTT